MSWYKNKVFLIIVFFSCAYAGYAIEQPCEDNLSVKLNDTTIKDGVIYYDGARYPKKYVYSKNISGEIQTMGCLCKVKSCFRKCCPLGSVMYRKKCTANDEFDIIGRQGLDIYYAGSYMKHVTVEESKFTFVFGRPAHVYLEDERPWYVQEDGTLYVSYPGNDPPWLIYGPDKYCIDTFVNDFKTDKVSGQGINALVCFASEKEQESHYGLSSSCMLISCFFILLTVAVYAWLPELRNLHGMVLMAYLLSFFVGFLFMATLQIMLSQKNITAKICLIFSFIIFYSILAAFFWLNVMCYDIWWTFSGKRASSGQSSVRRRFLRYCIYAFGMPTLLTALLAGLEFSDMPHSHPLLPNLRIQGCFLNGASKLLYLYGPIIILCIANLTFFVLTALKIYQIKSQTKKVLQSKESTTHDQDRKDKQRFSLYIKLFAVMGVNWILEVISSLYPEGDYLWQFTDAYNVLVGLIIFIIFVCKKKTIRMIQKRYRVVRGLPTMSRTQTTMSTSTRTYSTKSRDDVQMETIREPSQ